MQSTILPDAARLYRATSERVDMETTASTQIPAPVILVVATTVVFGAFSHRWLARRTRRRISPAWSWARSLFSSWWCGSGLR